MSPHSHKTAATPVGIAFFFFFFTSKKGQAQKVQRNIPAQSILFMYLFLAVLSLGWGLSLVVGAGAAL